MDDGEDDKELFTRFGNCKTAIREVFRISNKTATAERLVQHPQQKTSASDNAARFQEYALLTEWYDDGLITMFNRGLEDNVKDEFMRDSRCYESLTKITEVATTSTTSCMRELRRNVTTEDPGVARNATLDGPSVDTVPANQKDREVATTEPCQWKWIPHNNAKGGTLGQQRNQES